MGFGVTQFLFEGLKTKAPYEMLLLHCSQKLLTLYKSLAGSIPESLKVYSSLYYINHGNPFNMEVLVDSWPEYQTVIIRPQKQEMTDDMDPYTNVYRIFSKEPQKLQEVLNCGVINWKQMLQIQGCQESLGEGIRAIAFSNSVKVNYSHLLLYLTEDILQLKASTKSRPRSWCKAGHSDGDSERGDPSFKFSQLDVCHSALVNDSWDIGQNEKSLHYIQRCIQTLPAFCLQGPEGGPVTWATMDPSCEVGMAYTLDRHRGKGRLRQLLGCFVNYLRQENIPFYLSVLEENEKSRGAVEGSGFSVASCGWYQWICSPGK